jgi:hypothetical protein
MATGVSSRYLIFETPIQAMNINVNNPYTSSRIPLFARNVASTSHPLAAQAGLSCATA